MTSWKPLPPAHSPGICGPCTPLTHAERTKEASRPVAPIPVPSFHVNTMCGSWGSGPFPFRLSHEGRGGDLESMLRCVVVDEISRPYPLGPHPLPLPLPLPPPLLSLPSPCLPVSMDSAGDAVVLSHVPSIPLVLLFFSPSLFLFRFSSFRNRLGSRGVRMPMVVHSRWSLVRTDWMIQGGTRHHFTGPKRRVFCRPSPFLVDSQAINVPVCVRWHGMSHIGRSAWLAGWLGWHNRSRRASIHQSRIPSLRCSISPIPSSIHLSLFFNKKATSTNRRDHCMATPPYASDDSTAHCYSPLFQSQPRMAAQLLIQQRQIPMDT